MWLLCYRFSLSYMLCVRASFDFTVITRNDFWLFSPTRGLFASILCPYRYDFFFPFLTLSLEVNSFSSLCEDFLREAFVCVTISSFLNTTLTSSEPQNHEPALPFPLSSQILQKVANYLWPSSAAKASFSAQIMFFLHWYFPKPPESAMLTGGKEKGSHGFHLQVAYKRLIND